ncbi:MAG TPA: hypothetical protein VHG90_01060 [Acidimicrobiales bacterium]|nr:hypothetical protein [Acidimicrobiales bacterium]
MAHDEGGLGLSPFEEIERWAAEARARDAVDARVRERWLRRQAEEDATFAEALLDLAERGVAVVVTTTTNRRHIGPVEAVGADFVALRAAGGRTAVVALGAVAVVSAAGPGDGLARTAGGGDGGRRREVTVGLAEVLAHAAAQHLRVQVHAGDAGVVGELRSVGTDVISVHTDGSPPATAYLRLPSVSDVSFLDSG